MALLILVLNFIYVIFSLLCGAFIAMIAAGAGEIEGLRYFRPRLDDWKDDLVRRMADACKTGIYVPPGIGTGRSRRKQPMDRAFWGDMILNFVVSGIGGWYLGAWWATGTTPGPKEAFFSALFGLVVIQMVGKQLKR